MTHGGFDEKQWLSAKKEARDILVSFARAKKVITYSELVAQIKSIQLEHYEYALFHLLGEISWDESEAGRGMLSAVVVRIEDGRPGSGFFALAEDLGLDTSEPERLWIEQLNLVYDYWYRN